jgi:hypothetical protein
LEAASLPAASAPLTSTGFASRLALGLAAGVVAVLVPGEAGRLATQELTWRVLLRA